MRDPLDILKGESSPWGGFDADEPALTKGGLPVGTVHQWGGQPFKKVAEGKWVPAGGGGTSRPEDGGKPRSRQKPKGAPGGRVARKERKERKSAKTSKQVEDSANAARPTGDKVADGAKSAAATVRKSPRAALDYMKKVASHTKDEFKHGGIALKKLATGQKINHEERHALIGLGIAAAAGLFAGGSLAVAAKYFGKNVIAHMAAEAAHHALGKMYLVGEGGLVGTYAVEAVLHLLKSEDGVQPGLPQPDESEDADVDKAHTVYLAHVLSELVKILESGDLPGRGESGDDADEGADDEGTGEEGEDDFDRPAAPTVLTDKARKRLDELFGKDGEEVKKGKAYPVGTVRDWGNAKYRKMPNGKWAEVTEGRKPGKGDDPKRARSKPDSEAPPRRAKGKEESDSRPTAKDHDGDGAISARERERTLTTATPDGEFFDIEGQNIRVVGKGSKPVMEALKASLEESDDLCRAKPGVCNGNLGISRTFMPQLDPDPMKAFLRKLSGEGVGVKRKVVEVGDLRATQREILTSKVVGMGAGVRSGTFDKITSPIMVSSDGFIVDGHHRWATLMTLDPHNRMEVFQVDMPIRELVVATAQAKGTEFRSLHDGEAPDPKQSIAKLKEIIAALPPDVAGGSDRKAASRRHFDDLWKHKYTSRKRGANGKWQYTYPDPKQHRDPKQHDAVRSDWEATDWMEYFGYPHPEDEADGEIAGFRAWRNGKQLAVHDPKSGRTLLVDSRAGNFGVGRGRYQTKLTWARPSWAYDDTNRKAEADPLDLLKASPQPW